MLLESCSTKITCGATDVAMANDVSRLLAPSRCRTTCKLDQKVDQKLVNLFFANVHFCRGLLHGHWTVSDCVHCNMLPIEHSVTVVAAAIACWRAHAPCISGLAGTGSNMVGTPCSLLVHIPMFEGACAAVSGACMCGAESGSSRWFRQRVQEPVKQWIAFQYFMVRPRLRRF
eukprot:jgi/Ulvmu1/4073/UM019_0051.1